MSAPPILPRPQIPPISKTRKSLENKLTWNTTSFKNPQPHPAPHESEDIASQSGSDSSKATTRSFLGIISKGALAQHLEHATERKSGRDLASGFGTPFGQHYRAIGGDVAIVPGDVIKAALLPDGFVPRLRPPPAAKLPLALDVTVEAVSESYRFTYYEIDLSDRPLHSSPARTLHIQWSATEPRDAEVLRVTPPVSHLTRLRPPAPHPPPVRARANIHTHRGAATAPRRHPPPNQLARAPVGHPAFVGGRKQAGWRKGSAKEAREDGERRPRQRRPRRNGGVEGVRSCRYPAPALKHQQRIPLPKQQRPPVRALRPVRVGGPPAQVRPPSSP